MPEPVSSFRPGLYRHRGGGLYVALFVSTHHETDEAFVNYVSQDHIRSQVRAREWASPGKDSWTDVVEWPDGAMRPRFVLESELVRGEDGR